MRRLATALGALWLAAGCDPTQLRIGADGDTGPDPRAGFPTADVQLPPVPNLELVDVPPTYPDGAYSIAG